MIYENYTLILKIPVFIDNDGVIYTDALWEIDLSEHLKYIKKLRLCCPVLPFDREKSGLKRVAMLSRTQLSPLKADLGWLSVVRNILPNFWRVWQAARGAVIVHSGGAGWAFPPSYYLLLLRPFMAFKWIMVIESSFWMKPATGPVTLRQQISHVINGFLLRRCVRNADLRIFTQDWYRQFFLGSDRSATLIAPAVWVNEGDVLPRVRHIELLGKKTGPLRLLFPARLVADKGVETVLAAVPLLEQNLVGKEPIELDIIGDGPLADLCRRFVAAHRGNVHLRCLESVPYGEFFFRLLREYDAIIIANRQAEQPRIVFDAFSQGVTSIATRTSGIAEIVTDGETGMLYPIDDPEALADIIADLSTDRTTLATMSTNALAFVSGWTHQNMHKTREAFLVKHLMLSMRDPAPD